MKLARLFLISAIALLPSLPAAATTYKMVSDQTLVDQAAAVAEVRVTAVEPAPVEGRPATDYLVEVERLVKGHLPGSTIVVRVPGGVRPDGVGLKVFGAPEFYEGEAALLFLRPAEDGTYRILHLMLGAFHRRQVGARQVAFRDLSDAFAVGPAGLEEKQDLVRDFQRFSDWAADRGEGFRRERDYVLDVAPQELEQETGNFTHMKSDDGTPIRWFRFDSGQDVAWKVHVNGQSGLGIESSIQAFQIAVDAWNADAGSDIRYTYDGTTTAGAGLDHDDGINAILFDDPRKGEADGTFSCGEGGVIAVGGPFFYTSTRRWNGKSWHEAVEADIVTNDGTECFFRNNQKVAEEVFAHELGHTLGIGHAPTRDSLMFARAQNDGRGARLGSDDMAAAAALYPSSGGGNNGGGSSGLTAPTRLTARPVSGTEVQLSWRDRSSSETGFRIEAKTRGGKFREVLTVPAGSTSAVVTGLRPGKVYVFRVQALGGSGSSGYSNAARTVTPRG